MKLITNIIIGITTLIVGSKAVGNKTSSVEPHAFTVYQGHKFYCDRTDKHKSRHHAVLPKGYDPYFQDFYWN